MGVQHATTHICGRWRGSSNRMDGGGERFSLYKLCERGTLSLGLLGFPQGNPNPLKRKETKSKQNGRGHFEESLGSRSKGRAWLCQLLWKFMTLLVIGSAYPTESPIFCFVEGYFAPLWKVNVRPLDPMTSNHLSFIVHTTKLFQFSTCSRSRNPRSDGWQVTRIWLRVC